MSRIITFYSYKGGVGRTFALANVAVLLAQRGKRVLLMDWDLEAPGLHRYFHKFVTRSVREPQGLVHFLNDIGRNQPLSWNDFVTRVDIPDCKPIHLIASGDQAPDYVDRVRTFSWAKFFEESDGGSHLERWRNEWKESYDYVLVDSRTGITDTGGVCTIFLPDILVLVFSANEQSFERGIQIANGVQKARQNLSVPRPPVAVLPIPGRFDGRDEVDLAQQWLDRFAVGLTPFFDDWLPSSIKPRQILELTKVPYITKFSFGEPLPVLSHGTTDPEFPGYYLDNITRLLITDFKSVREIVFPDSSKRESYDVKVDISRIVIYAPSELVGRGTEISVLDDAWERASRGEKGQPNVISIVGLGGEGKSALVANWAVALAGRGWPGCEAAFAWSFYNEAYSEQKIASSDLFLKTALDFFGDEEDRKFAAGPATPFEKGQRLARVVGQRRCLLILDGVESLQYPPTFPAPGELADRGLVALFRGLAIANLGLCVITTRFSITDLRPFLTTSSSEVLLGSLSRSAGAGLLQRLGVRGRQSELVELADDLNGHALTLQIMGSFLHRAFNGDIRQRDRVRFEKADETFGAGHAMRTMAAYENWLLSDGGDEGRREVATLRLLGLFDGPADIASLTVLRKSPAIPGLTEPLMNLSHKDWEICLTGLEASHLITENRDTDGELLSLDAHPLLREYFARQIREQNLAAYREAHQRMFEYVCATTTDKPQPTLQDLQPLYHALSHGCAAGLHQRAFDEVYLARIRRGRRDYLVRQLGAFGAELTAVGCFFDEPWSRVSSALTETDQSWLLTTAALCLRALGRLTEALEPMRAQISRSAKSNSWGEAAICANNLSDLELTLGKITAAVRDAKQSMDYARRSGDKFRQIVACATSANALHQAGQLAEAESLFQEAEKVQADAQPAYPLLYSTHGFHYCELLLSSCEVPAWRVKLGTYPKAEDRDKLVAICRDVSKRAEVAFDVSSRNASLADAALHQLTLGRASLYSAVLDNTDFRLSAVSFPQIEAAVSTLRRVGQQEFLAKSLLTRAFLRFLAGAEMGTDSAQADFDEARLIAEHGSMSLLLCDVYLYRARLFGNQQNSQKYPWESANYDLNAARKIIESTGYRRRVDELNDAEQVILEERKSDALVGPDSVFISYSHDSEDHRDRVLQLSERLRSDGIETILDRYVERGSPSEGWTRWLVNSLERASHVLCVCSERYCQRFLGLELTGQARGVDWEGAIMTQSLINARQGSNKFIPVVFESSDSQFIPLPLRNQPFVVLDSSKHYELLLDILFATSGVEPPKIGSINDLPRTSEQQFDLGETRAAYPSQRLEESPATMIWREKLEYLLAQEALSADPHTKFQVAKLIQEARLKIEEIETLESTKRPSQPTNQFFDVFLISNSKDKAVVRELKNRLLKYSLSVWLDEDELAPGIAWQRLLEDGISKSDSIVLLVGKDGLGSWQDEEMQVTLRYAVAARRPVIPVLMPGAASQPKLPVFLASRTWVDLRGGFTKDGLDKLVWGITGKKPNS